MTLFPSTEPRESRIHSLSHLCPDKIPVAVQISQKAAVNQSENVFFRGKDVVFSVHLHDPSGYLKTAAALDYIWDFRDGNQLVTHRNVTTHTYSQLGTMNVKLVVEAAFPVECPPTSAPSTGTERNLNMDSAGQSKGPWLTVRTFNCTFNMRRR